jgi:hypothetical protein
MNDTALNAILARADAAANESNGLAVEAGMEWWSTTNAMTMCSVLLLFGLIVMGLTTFLLKNGHPGQSILRIFGTFLVIIMATFLVVAGYTNEQIGAPLGLLGTIAGYLLGRQPTGDQDRAPSH